MAELIIGAPIAAAEADDDWNDFEDTKDFAHSTASKKDMSESTTTLTASQTERDFMDSFLDRGKSSSLEDLVKNFDQKLTECFRDYRENVSSLAPQNIRSQEEIINSSPAWMTLTGSYGNAPPIDWSKCYMRELQYKALHLDASKDPRESPERDPDLSDEDELREALDAHTIVSPMVGGEMTEEINADDVIQEIDTIMKLQDSMTTNDTGYATEPDMLTSAESDSIHFKDIPSPITRVNLSEEIQDLSVRQLNDMVYELQNEIEVRSHILVQELAAREDVIYERELKNTFIALCHKVMRKGKPSNSKDKKKSKSLTEATSMSGTTYVVPYQLTQMPPTNDLLQVYIRILKAIYEDSPTVPTLLTEYILKVVCPTN